MSNLKRKSDAAQLSRSLKPAKSSKPTSSAQPFKSAEIVVESDGDNEASRGQSVTKKTATASTVKPRNVNEAKISSPHPAAPKHISPGPETSKTRKYAIPSLSSTASGGRSSKSSNSSVVPVPTPLRRTAVESSQSETDSEASSDEDDEEDSDSDSESDDDVELQKSKGISATPKPLPYVPPPGFESSTIEFPASSSECNVLREDYLRGKQIWHITAPASVPIDTIKEVPVQKVATGEAILKHEENEYGLVAETDLTSNRKVLLIPSIDHNCYHVAGANITRTLHLQHIVDLPSRNSDNTVAGSDEKPRTHVKTIRQQPERLGMPYRPIGDATSSDSSDEASQFKIPPIFRPSRDKPIAKAPSNGEPGPVNAAPPSKESPSPSKKSSKPEKEKSSHKKSTTKPLESSSTPQMSQTSSAALLERAWKSAFPNSSAAKDSTATNGSTPMPGTTSRETAEERAKRKAEKKRRKQGNDVREDSPIHVNGDRREDEAPMSEKKKKRKSEAADGTKEMSVNGNNETRNPEPDSEKPKAKRKKRKSEATTVDA